MPASCHAPLGVEDSIPGVVDAIVSQAGKSGLRVLDTPCAARFPGDPAPLPQSARAVKFTVTMRAWRREIVVRRQVRGSFLQARFKMFML